MKLSLALLEKNMVTCGFYFIGLPCTIWKSFELRVSLWRAHELNLKIFGSEQALVSGNKPREGEDSASCDIAYYFLIQRSTPMFSATTVLDVRNPHGIPNRNSVELNVLPIALAQRHRSCGR
jgi:hypothetical protein